MKSLTISDVAKAAGVSKTTLSRFLNKNYSHMSIETKKRIEDVVKELNYHPNRHAQSLKLHKTKEIGIQIADITNTYVTELLKGIGEILRKYNYQMIIMDAANSKELEKKQLQSLVAQKVDGIIMQPVSFDSHDYEFIDEYNIPIVLVDRETIPNKWPTITSDNQGIIEKLAQQFLNRNYQRVITVSDPLTQSSTRLKRYETMRNSFLKNKKQSGLIELNEEIPLETAIEKICNLNQKTAFFTVNSSVLEKVLAAIKKLDLDFPTDLGLASYDGWTWTQLIKNGITTIDQNPVLIGQTSAKMLLNHFKNEGIRPPLKTIIPAKLVIKESF